MRVVMVHKALVVPAGRLACACQLGLAVSLLMPPPPALRFAGFPLLGGALSFQTCSGKGTPEARAELITSVPLATCQNWTGGVMQVDALHTAELGNSLPPMAVTY